MLCVRAGGEGGGTDPRKQFKRAAVREGAKLSVTGTQIHSKCEKKRHAAKTRESLSTAKGVEGDEVNFSRKRAASRMT